MIEWNDREVLRNVKSIAEDVAEKGAEMTAQDARRLVPVKTGALKESIEVHKSKFEDGGYVVSAGSKKLFYASFVELGTDNLTAKPFLRPALSKNKSKIKKMFRDALK